MKIHTLEYMDQNRLYSAFLSSSQRFIKASHKKNFQLVTSSQGKILVPF